jgi:hypothetical protein
MPARVHGSRPRASAPAGLGLDARTVRPNVEVTGATRQDGQAVRPMMNYGGRTAWLACRGASG